jgi:hypothetical protein
VVRRVLDDGSEEDIPLDEAPGEVIEAIRKCKALGNVTEEQARSIVSMLPIDPNAKFYYIWGPPPRSGEGTPT